MKKNVSLTYVVNVNYQTVMQLKLQATAIMLPEFFFDKAWLILLIIYVIRSKLYTLKHKVCSRRF